MTHEEHHRLLVARLAGGIAPVQRLWPTSVRLALWLALEGAVLAWVMIHARSDFMIKLGRPVYFIEFLFFSTAAIVAAGLALRSAIPGSVLRASERILCTVLVLAGTALVTVGKPPDINAQLSEFVKVGIPCAYATCMLAALPLLVLWWMVRRGAPLRGGISGLWVGAGALFFAFAMMRIACPIDDPLHLIIWHLLPVLAVIALSACAGRVWLGFGARLQRRYRPA